MATLEPICLNFKNDLIPDLTINQLDIEGSVYSSNCLPDNNKNGYSIHNNNKNY